MSDSFFNNVIASALSLAASQAACGEFSRLLNPFVSIGRYLSSPVMYLYWSILIHLASISFMDKIPSSIASFTAVKSLIGAAGASNISFPASNAFTDGLSDFLVVAPFMASASVKQRPLKPSSSCNSPVTIGREKEEGRLRVLSSAGT